MATSVANDPRHYLLLPGSKTADWPVIGIEDPQVLTKKLEKIWDLAWKVAYKPYSVLSGNIGPMPGLPVADWSCQIGIGLNPASARSMHQMHIHVVVVVTRFLYIYTLLVQRWQFTRRLGLNH